MVDLILFPSSFFSINNVDEDLQSEYEAVINTGLFDTVFFNYYKWDTESVIKLNSTPSVKRKAIMRGWMMKPEKYRDFYNKLLNKNVELVTHPDEYEQMHIFPHIYSMIEADTAKMQIYNLNDKIDVEDIKKNFSRFMIKDFVKSVKGTEFPKYFDHSITQDKFDEWMQVFYKYRGELLTGGICIKEFLDLKRYGKSTNEYRVVYVNNEVMTIDRNSGQPDYTEVPPNALIEKYKNLPSCYYTVDYAELEDGTWKIIEAGDGSVSGLTESQDIEHYFRSLYHILGEHYAE